jgi:hypothetical protein
MSEAAPNAVNAELNAPLQVALLPPFQFCCLSLLVSILVDLLAGRVEVGRE